MKQYSIKNFNVDILREAYEPIHIIRTINVEIKLKILKYKTCSWDHCKKTVNTTCANQLRQKLPCPSHSCLICQTCYSDPALPTKFNIRKNVPLSPLPRPCRNVSKTHRDRVVLFSKHIGE